MAPRGEKWKFVWSVPARDHPVQALPTARRSRSHAYLHDHRVADESEEYLAQVSGT